MRVYTLPKQTLTVWRIRVIALLLALLALFLLFFKLLFVLLFIAVPLLTAVLLAVFWLLPSLHRNYSIELHDKVTVIKKGIFIKREYIMPYGGMIYAERVETPLSKKFGLTGMKLHAAKKSLSISLLEEEKAKEFTHILQDKKV